MGKQTIKPDYLVVFQNESHIDISGLKEKYKFIHIKSDYNTKYFGRFASCFTFPVDICMVLDDDIIPGPNCLKNYMDQCINLNAIIGGNGRVGMNNPNKPKLNQPRDVGIRNNHSLVDFVGHLWCFKKEWLHYMFALLKSSNHLTSTIDTIQAALFALLTLSTYPIRTIDPV